MVTEQNKGMMKSKKQINNFYPPQAGGKGTYE